MKVLLLGNGGRESALAYKIRSSKLLKELKVYPGNGGFLESEIIPRNSINLKNKIEVQNFIKHEKFDLVVVGPEEPLVYGISDWLSEISIPCFGPSQYCSMLEGSKDFAKKLMNEFGVPTANHKSFENYESAYEYLKTSGVPIVIKADGLAAGKGVTVAFEMKDAEIALKDIFINHKFGMSGNRVVIEEFMDGDEASIFAISDGNEFLLFPAAQDHKRAYDDDLGPNTGGMGAYTPAPIVNEFLLNKIKEEIFDPMFKGLKSSGNPYKGLLYAGLMIKEDDVKVVEFNCRFGDPETQALLLLLEDDLLEIMLEAAKGSFNRKILNFYDGYASVVVLSAEGYPGDYKKGIILDKFKNIENSEVIIFHAGTEILNTNLISNGGRILGITSKAKTLKESLDKCYNFLKNNQIPSTFYRNDIGRKAL